MPLFLKGRAEGLEEKMDSPHADPAMLARTYRRFGLVNRAVSGWERVYGQYLKPLMQRGESYRLLDVGFGGADVTLALDRWAKADGLTLELTGVDIDTRALDYVSTLETPPNVRFRQASTGDLLAAGERYDFVISNHVLHHLEPPTFRALCEETQGLATRRVVHNDLERSDVAYLGFSLTTPFFRDSFITTDGLTSIRRSYTHEELAKTAPPGWRVETLFPYRLLLIYDANP